MAAPTRTTFSEQEIQNQSYDPELGVSATEQLGFDGVNVQRMPAAALAMKKTVVAGITYLAFAAPGTDEAIPKWQARCIDETDPTSVTITWADGDADFNNDATDLTMLTYS